MNISLVGWTHTTSVVVRKQRQTSSARSTVCAETAIAGFTTGITCRTINSGDKEANSRTRSLTAGIGGVEVGSGAGEAVVVVGSVAGEASRIALETLGGRGLEILVGDGACCRARVVVREEVRICARIKTG